MRKKMLFLAFALATVAASLTTSRAVAGNHSCPQCTVYADCSQCCVSCICDDEGNLVSCTDHFCPPPDGPPCSGKD